MSAQKVGSSLFRYCRRCRTVGKEAFSFYEVRLEIAWNRPQMRQHGGFLCSCSNSQFYVFHSIEASVVYYFGDEGEDASEVQGHENIQKVLKGMERAWNVNLDNGCVDAQVRRIGVLSL